MDDYICTESLRGVLQAAMKVEDITWEAGAWGSRSRGPRRARARSRARGREARTRTLSPDWASAGRASCWACMFSASRARTVGSARARAWTRGSTSCSTARLLLERPDGHVVLGLAGCWCEKGWGTKTHSWWWGGGRGRGGVYGGGGGEVLGRSVERAACSVD